MQTAEAWNTGRPIFSRLPEVYKNNLVADYLTNFFDELLYKTKLKVDDIPRQLNPLNCDSNWLDFLAPLCGFTGKYWDRSWQDNHKRNLLFNSYKKIWNNKGSKEGLSTVLSCFEIPHAIGSRNDFILGFSKVGVDPLGNSAYEYTIYLKNSYRDTPQVKLVEKLNKLFGPCWCKSNIEFNNSAIKDYLILDNDQTIIYTLL